MLLEKTKTTAQFLERVSSLVEERLGVPYSGYIDRILKYPLMTKGQMIRPFLIYLSAMSVNRYMDMEQTRKLEYFAAAVELLHNASLIHDDVLDMETSRRGVDCLYRVYGDKNAILAGNVYYIRAIETVVGHADGIQVRNLLDTAAEMCFGEILQQKYEGKTMPDPVYFDVIRKKTAALTSLACKEAARIAGADEYSTSVYGKLGELLGIAYQLQDDCRDRDANLRTGFNYRCNIESCLRQMEDIVQQLPDTEFLRWYEDFIQALTQGVYGV